MSLIGSIIEGAKGGAISGGIEGLGQDFAPLGSTPGGEKITLKSSSQQTQNMNFNPVISVGGPANGADTPFSSAPNYSNAQDDRQAVGGGAYLPSTASEPGPTVNPSATAKSPASNYGTILLVGAIGVAAFFLLKG